MRGDHGLHAVGDDLTARQAVLHAGVAHGNAIIYTDGIEHKRHTASLTNGAAHHFAKGLQVHVSRHDVHIRVGDRDERFAHVSVRDAGGFE